MSVRFSKCKLHYFFCMFVFSQKSCISCKYINHINYWVPVLKIVFPTAKREVSQAAWVHHGLRRETPWLSDGRTELAAVLMGARNQHNFGRWDGSRKNHSDRSFLVLSCEGGKLQILLMFHIKNVWPLWETC